MVPADRPTPAPLGHSHRIRNGIVELVVGNVALQLIVWVVPGLRATSWLGVPSVVVAAALVGAAVRPPLVSVATRVGVVGIVAVGLFGHVLVAELAMELSPWFESRNWWTTFVAAWLYAAASTALEWMLVSDADEVFLARVIRSSRGVRGRPTDAPGVVFVQLDGMPAPLLDFGIRSGNLPNLARWVRGGSHTWRPWRAQVPCTTPVSQAGILHGSTEGMPAFRWYEKDAGRLIVANHPADAATIEARITDGRGLLADDGVSIANLFSGDAPETYLVMSRTRLGRGALGPTPAYSAFFSEPSGFVRALVLSLAEMAKEVFQARQQRVRDIEPRVSRHGSYIVLRAVTNVLMRDLCSALVVRSMMRGKPSIYVDFVDYDEIAHHAGVARPESLDSLVGLDRVLGLLERAATHAPRPYHFVVLSDHGQSQGATFRQRHGGRALEDVVRDLLGPRDEVAASTAPVEKWGPANLLLGRSEEGGGMRAKVVESVISHRSQRGSVALGPAEVDQAQAAVAKGGDGPDIVVIGSGNLGGIWFARRPGRLTLEDLEVSDPGLVGALAGTDGIGFVVTASVDRGPVATGPRGRHWLAEGRIEGEDPLAPFGPRAAADMLRAARLDHAPDLYVNSDLDPVTGEVSAFEELVGCHGGLGGWQTEASLLHPAAWVVPDHLLDDDELVGAERVHRTLVGWLEDCGQRVSSAAPSPTP